MSEPNKHMAPEVAIRVAEASDAQSIGQLAREFHSYLKSRGATTKFDFTADTYLRDGFGERPAFRALVAESGGVVIGYLILHLTYDTDHSRREAYVDDLYVQDAWRGRGIGNALLSRAADLARSQHGAEGLWWGVHDGNEAAFRFYESLGATYVSGIRFMSIDISQLD